jgi:hypothetical protein
MQFGDVKLNEYREEKCGQGSLSIPSSEARANESGARVKVSSPRMRRDYLGGRAILAVARLKNELIGHVIASTLNDSKYGGMTDSF